MLLSSVVAVISVDQGVLNFRTPFGLPSDDMARLIRSTLHVAELHSQLPAGLKDRALANCEHTVAAKTERFARAMFRVDFDFSSKVFKYALNSLVRYCETALELIAHAPDTSDTIDSIRFGDDHEFCVHSFLFGSPVGGRRVDLLFHITFYLQTFSRGHRAGAVESLQTQLKAFVERFADGQPEKDASPDNADSKTRVRALTDRLSDMRETIAQFSKLFCLPTLPTLVDKDFQVSQQSRGYPDDHLIDNILYTEEFIVVVSILCIRRYRQCR